ncbi:MAG: LD-carboxypeptidase [Chthonomonas sp.]|nr:LD-carboxypeptidase [Chthonomonas sp.]
MSDLTRRTFLAGASAAMLAPAATLAAATKPKGRAMIRPPHLRAGDTVAIIAPAGVTDGPDNLPSAAKNLENLGFKVVIGPRADEVWGYLAGHDEARAEDFNWAVKNPEVRGIITLRGGYGTMRMLPMLDYDAFRKHRKVVSGYSDITGLLTALTRKSEVITFHGPIAEAKFEGFEGEWWKRAVMNAQAMGVLATPTALAGRPVEPAAQTLRGGKAQGRLIGGNLSLIAATAGTPYGPDFRDAILFLEDTNEAPYRVDRMLTTLWLGGHLQQLKGLVFADFRPPKIDRDAGPNDDVRSFSLVQVLQNTTDWLKVPVFTGLYAGHIKDKLTLPIGAKVSIDADRRMMTVLEPAVD